MTNPAIPVWALQRVNTVLAEHQSGRTPASTADLARRTGLSKRMVRRCLFHSRKAMGNISNSTPKPAMQSINH